MSGIKCSSCGLVLLNPKFAIDAERKEIAFCSKCLYKNACVFCDPPVINEHCSIDHFVGVKKGNRFTEDETFVAGARFEFD